MSLNDKEFQALLASRPVEPPRAGFAERIIAASKYTKPSPASGFSVWLYALLGDFLLPKPAFALASVLALGLVIGLIAPSMSGDEDMSVQAYLESDGAVL